MCPTEYYQVYMRHLPHMHPPGATFFVTCRLAGSLPRAILHELRIEAERVARELDDIPTEPDRARQAHMSHRRLFAQWDTKLDEAGAGPVWLEKAKVAQVIADSLHHRDDRVYELLAYCIMPNHVHVVFKPLPDTKNNILSVTTIMQSLKGYTAFTANRLLNRRAQFWQRESYDHWVRDEKELLRIIRYVISNPVKAGLTHHWQEWPWTYCKHPPLTTT